MLKFRTYLFEIVLWIFIPYAIVYVIYNFALKFSFETLPVIPASMIVLGALFFPILKKIAVVPDRKRVMLFYGNIGLKMLLSLAIILVVVLTDRSNALYFVLTFFLFYILLMIFEVRCFLKVVKLTKVVK